MQDISHRTPTLNRDPELVSYEFSAAKQRLQLEHPDAHIFNSAEDLDTEPYLELALACNFNPDDPIDRLQLLFSELMDSSSIYFISGWEMDKLCRRLYSSAKEVQIVIHELQSTVPSGTPSSS